MTCIELKIHPTTLHCRERNKKSTHFYNSSNATSKSASKHLTVFAYARLLIDRQHTSGKARTAEIYHQVLNSFIKFRCKKDLPFSKFSQQLVERYEIYLKSNNLCRNTTSFYLRTLRSIYNQAVEENLVTQTYPFKRVYTGIDKTAKRALSLSAISRIKEADLQARPSLAFARDIFLFSFYTRGMSFVDIAYLKIQNLSHGFLVYNRHKTGQQLTIRWEPCMQDIVNKYTSSCDGYLLPIINASKGHERQQYLNKMLIINRQLKKIAELAGISTSLTMYVARHSWASIAQQHNIPLQAISLGMGHENEETTRIYLASIQTNAIDEANRRIIKLLNKK